MDARVKPKRVQIEATVIRADGTRVDLGRISDSSRWWLPFLANHRIRRANRRMK